MTVYLSAKFNNCLMRSRNAEVNVRIPCRKLFKKHRYDRLLGTEMVSVNEIYAQLLSSEKFMVFDIGG